MTDDWIASLVAQGFREEAVEASGQESPKDVAILQLVSDVREGRYREAYMGLRALGLLDQEEKKRLINAANESYLMEKQLEWTNHGILRSFRFWSLEEKQAYLRLTVEVMSCCKTVTPHVTLGFGSVLAFMRDNDFVPHDDDMDILVAFPLDVVRRYPEALELLRKAFEANGLRAHGDYPSHRNVNKNNGKSVDVFVGFIEDGRVSWFPSRRGNLRVEDVFPAENVDFLGIECEIPANPNIYLEATYGDSWKTPIANWNHPWNRREYSDFE
jgi:hypothetical protein